MKAEKLSGIWTICLDVPRRQVQVEIFEEQLMDWAQIYVWQCYQPTYCRRRGLATAEVDDNVPVRGDAHWDPIIPWPSRRGSSYIDNCGGCSCERKNRTNNRLPFDSGLRKRGSTMYIVFEVQALLMASCSSNT
jgi:hypothetical protein